MSYVDLVTYPKNVHAANKWCSSKGLILQTCTYEPKPMHVDLYKNPHEIVLVNLLT